MNVITTLISIIITIPYLFEEKTGYVFNNFDNIQFNIVDIIQYKRIL